LRENFMPLALLLLGYLAGAVLTPHGTPSMAAEPVLQTAGAPQASRAAPKPQDADDDKDDDKAKTEDKAGNKDDEKDDDDEPSPEKKMQARFPQPVRVGFLIGLPVLDYGDSTIGYIQQVVRTSDGKIQLIVPYSRWFGWARPGGIFGWGKRPVAVPIETVAILARQLDALEMAREDFDDAPTWTTSEGQPIPLDEKITIAIARR
jgi:hypothetical protein